MKNLIQVPTEKIESKIYLIRGVKIMFDTDLANLYQVEIRALNQAIKRNEARFPEDFMFQLNKKEYSAWKEFSLRSQSVILKQGEHRKYLPYVFTESGIAMLSSVLKSERAIQVNIQIMRTFSKIREMLLTNKELREKIEKLEKKYDSEISTIFRVLKNLIIEKEKPKTEIGFRTK